jgi:hypothetical protein
MRWPLDVPVMPDATNQSTMGGDEAGSSMNTFEIAKPAASEKPEPSLAPNLHIP